jgi:hypothetical protein
MNGQGGRVVGTEPAQLGEYFVGNHDRYAGFVEYVKESHSRQEDERRGVHDATEDHAVYWQAGTSARPSASMKSRRLKHAASAAVPWVTGPRMYRWIAAAIRISRVDPPDSWRDLPRARQEPGV